MAKLFLVLSITLEYLDSGGSLLFRLKPLYKHDNFNPAATEITNKNYKQTKIKVISWETHFDLQFCFFCYKNQ